MPKYEVARKRKVDVRSADDITARALEGVYKGFAKITGAATFLSGWKTNAEGELVRDESRSSHALNFVCCQKDGTLIRDKQGRPTQKRYKFGPTSNRFLNSAVMILKVDDLDPTFVREIQDIENEYIEDYNDALEALGDELDKTNPDATPEDYASLEVPNEIVAEIRRDFLEYQLPLVERILKETKDQIFFIEVTEETLEDGDVYYKLSDFYKVE